MYYHFTKLKVVKENNVAWTGNRTRASRVAGENSTTEPPMPVAPFLCPIGNLGLGFVSSFFSMQDIGYPPLDITVFV